MRLIDANALLKRLQEQQKYGSNQDGRGRAKAILEVIHAPTIEAEPVRHGRMTEGRYPDENKCSECGQEFRDDIGFIIQDDDGVFRYPKRCPECGCYWDGGADNIEKNCENCARETCAVMPPSGKCYCDFWQAMTEPPESEARGDET